MVRREAIAVAVMLPMALACGMARAQLPGLAMPAAGAGLTPPTAGAVLPNPGMGMPAFGGFGGYGGFSQPGYGATPTAGQPAVVAGPPLPRRSIGLVNNTPTRLPLAYNRASVLVAPPRMPVPPTAPQATQRAAYTPPSYGAAYTSNSGYTGGIGPGLGLLFGGGRASNFGGSYAAGYGGAAGAYGAAYSAPAATGGNAQQPAAAHQLLTPVPFAAPTYLAPQYVETLYLKDPSEPAPAGERSSLLDTRPTLAPAMQSPAADLDAGLYSEKEPGIGPNVLALDNPASLHLTPTAPANLRLALISAQAPAPATVPQPEIDYIPFPILPWPATPGAQALASQTGYNPAAYSSFGTAGMFPGGGFGALNMGNIGGYGGR